MRTLFDQRGRAAACWQGAREASELNPTLSARQLATVRNRPFSYNSRNLPIEGQSHGHRNNVDNPYADLSVAGD